jgi:hypothetical protein
MTRIVDLIFWLWLRAGAPTLSADAPPFGIDPESWAMGMGLLLVGYVFGMALGVGVLAGAVAQRWFDIVVAGMLPPAIFLRMMAFGQTFETCSIAAASPSLAYISARWWALRRSRRSAGSAP